MSRRRASVLVLVTAACVGLPPSPPGADGSTTDADAGTATADTGPIVDGTTTSTGASESGTETTGNPFDPSCGDGLVEAPEECDLGELNGSGMYCTNECQANVCGDGYVGPGEACDDGNESSEDLCTTLCGPTTCGDGVIQAPEECDRGKANATSGPCLPSCIAASCGDGYVYVGVEACDGAEIGTDSCKMQGYAGGVLLCTVDCAGYDVSNCYACGNGIVEPGEECDGAEVAGLTCAAYGYDSGEVVCSGSCTADASGCYTCGNEVVEGIEQCDGMELAGGTCETVAGMLYAGPLGCDVACSYDASACCLVTGAPCTGDGECCSGVCTGDGACE